MYKTMGQHSSTPQAFASPALIVPQNVMLPQQRYLHAPTEGQASNNDRKTAKEGDSVASCLGYENSDYLHRSEWPTPYIKTGPPPGTKIPQVREVTVRPLTLSKGTRLTVHDVDQQIKDCIDVLNEAKEHVSLERVEELLLKKFQVQYFSDLNLPMKNISFMPTAKEHLLLLRKVNAYVQNFVRSRSLCTLFELQECCREFHPKRETFENLKLGPLQKMPVVYDFFKFPLDEYIPEITSPDLMQELKNFFEKNNKWTQLINVEEFMQYLTETYQVSNGYSLGIRLRSLPLAIHTLKKSTRDAAATRSSVINSLNESLQSDVHKAFENFRASILQSSDKSLELRRHYMNLTPEKAIREIFTKFELLTQIFNSSPSLSKNLKNILKHYYQFVNNILKVQLPRQLFHLSVCMSDLELEECATEILEADAKQQQLKEETLQSQQQQTPKKVPPTKGQIETKVSNEDYEFESFQDMGYGTFLEFIHSEQKIKKVMEDCGDVLGSTNDQDSVFKPSLLELNEFLCQARLAGLAQNSLAESSVCEQYHVSDIRHLGHGNISRLCSTANTPGKHISSEYNTCFEAALCGKVCLTTQSKGQVGLCGSISREAAMACLTICPLLEDLETWSNWSMVFQPQHGRLKEFIKKNGGLKKIDLEAGTKIAISDFKALEVMPGKFLKLSACTTVEHFVRAVQRDDPYEVAGQLVSLIVANKGIENTPLVLVTNHLKTKLISLHALSTAAFTPATGSSPVSVAVDQAVQFVTFILLRLPVRMCVAIANQVLLEPLSQVVGSAKSKQQILQMCLLTHQEQHLEQLGCLLGIQEWASTIQKRFVFPAHCIEEIAPDELLGSPNVYDYDEEISAYLKKDEFDLGFDIDELLDEVEQEAANQIQGCDNKKSTVQPGQGEISDAAEAANNETNVDMKEKQFENKTGANETKNVKDQQRVKDQENFSEEYNSNVEMQEYDQDKEDPTNKLEQSVEIIQERELTLEDKCRLIVDDIRREEFGVGIKLDEAGQNLMQKQQERQGRSLQRLSKDLYSKETHFVLELIQNADDNSYNDDVSPSIKFVIDHAGVKVLNNELGFKEKNIRAICDVGKSTKSKHTSGYIGQKGIGFKSVFRMTGCPEVHSNGFHIYFDINDGPMGYILPHWKENFELDENWQTQIILPWTEDIKQQVHTHAARFNDIQPSLLLFLHRLKEITIENKVEGSRIFMSRQDFENGDIKITHSHGTDKWLVLRKTLDATNISLQAKSGVEVESTEIALAFPLKNTKLMKTQMKLEKLPVFAFLPLRSYGFRFIVQGDFDVPSSREDVDRDSFWNQWLRNEIHVLFIEALQAFKTIENLTPVEALIQYLQFIPLEGEVMAFFKPVASQILDQLRAKECMPVLTADKKTVEWKMPLKTVICHDTQVLDIVSPQVLHQYLDLNYLHSDIAAFLKLNEPLTKALGIESVATEHLLHIGRFLVQHWDGADHVTDIAKWLACVYRSLDDFQENTETLQELQNMRMIPLSSGSLVSLSDMAVFIFLDPQWTQQTAKSNETENNKDYLVSLMKDLNLVHGDLVSTGDNEVNSQVVKLLLKLGIKQLNAYDLIHSHILPVFKSDAWKDKRKFVLVSYLVYIKTELEKNSSVVDRSELSVVKLVTNHGIKSPADDVHFPTQYGNKIDLIKTFPGLDWILVDTSYLPMNPSQQDRQSWHMFLSELGVTDFLKVTKVERSFDKTSIHETAWSSMEDSSDGYSIEDFQCDEFYKLVTANQKPDKMIPQMVKLFEYIDVNWNLKYKFCLETQIKSGSGQVLKGNILSSFAVHLQSLSWVPSVSSSLQYNEDNHTVDLKVKESLDLPAELYLQDQVIQRLLHHTVKYLNVAPQKNSSFIVFLKIKDTISSETLTQALISWSLRAEDSPEKPKLFCTSLWHMRELYAYLSNEMKLKACQDLFLGYPVIFVPIPNQNVRGADNLAGWMIKKDEAWWSDPTDLFPKYLKSLEKYKSPLSKFKILKDIYNHMEYFIKKFAKVEKSPTTLQYAQLLKHIVSVCCVSEDGVLFDSLLLISKIGQDLSKISSKEAGVKTIEAMKAESNLPKVKELLSKAAVFPIKLGQWVSLSDSPMIADSKELEEMFGKKPGVHLLQLDVRGMKGKLTLLRPHCSSTAGFIDPKGVDFFISLFEDIKPLSECIKTEEVTCGFKPCNKGQTYLHNIVGLVQRFMYFRFPEAYKQFKAKKSSTLKHLSFIQVNHLEVKYELIGKPDIFVIREEKCVVTEQCFYFHEKYIDSHVEIIKELAKYFSDGDEDCFRELRNFLPQVNAILEDKGDETFEELLQRQVTGDCTLPTDEDVWEVSLPTIAVTPVPQPTYMVYGYQAQSFSVGSVPQGDENPVLKSWPPKSAVDHFDIIPIKKDQNIAPGIWPPPLPASESTNVYKLPSSIKFECTTSKDELSTGEKNTLPDEDYSTQKHSILRHDGQLECSFNMQVSTLSESNRAIESDHIHQNFKLSQGHSGNGCCKHKDTNHTQVQCIDSNSGSNKELELTGNLTQQISEPGDLSSFSSDVHKELGLAEKT
ncbi:protein NO VEIN isoform X6, partial [Biomphalaria pfeifferi]